MTTNTLSQSAAGEDAAGVVVLAADGTTAFADDAAAAWIDELGGRRSITALASTAVTGPGIAGARVQAESGRWLVVRASALADRPDAQVAVLIEPARPHELAPLVAQACGLTERERQVTQLVARGLSTAAISQRLFMSPWTVQDHLKAIFEKVGVATRGELVARVFFQQRLPEL
jgi:DNA-binding CsgD family transcriptional regulator